MRKPNPKAKPSPSPAPRKGSKVTRGTKAKPSRSEAMRLALAAKRAAMEDPGFSPCLWCGNEIPVDRRKAAASIGKSPSYCSEDCRKNKPESSFILHVWHTSLGVSKDDRNAWREEYERRATSVLQPTNPRKKTKAA